MKKLIYYLLFTGLMLSCFLVKAQDFALGIRGGISIPNLTAGSGNHNPLSTGYSSRLGPDAGVFAEFQFSNLFSLQPMVEYSSQGGKKNGLQAITTPDEFAARYPPGQAPQYLYANYNSEAKLNYLIIPVLGKFGWNFKKSSPLRFYLDAGPFAGFLLSAHQVTSGQSEFYTDPGKPALPGGPQSFNKTTDIKDHLHTFNLGFEANIGFNYKFGLNNVFIEGGGNFGVLNIQKFAQDGNNNAGAGTLVIGYSYWFCK